MALSTASNIQRADPSTIQNKFLAGYQGWFTCAGDGPPIGNGHHGWIHWMGHPGAHLNIDFWPDMSEYSPSELYPVPGLKYLDGSQAHLFSSRNPKTVQRHFHWAAENGVDGFMLQRFVGQCDMAPERDNDGIRRLRDEVGDVVRDAAEKEGRVFAIMYDLAGVGPDRIERIIRHDWLHLLRDKRVLDSPNYLYEKGKPVITVWGFGFEFQEGAPEIMRAVTDFIRNSTPGGAYIIGGMPAPWRDMEPWMAPAYMECFDAITPWTVGVYSKREDIDWFAEWRIKRDIEYLETYERETGKHVDYLPTILPGSSGYNTSEGKWVFNGSPRDGGKYLWRQLWQARRHGAKMFYGAMWDEYDEATNYLPIVSQQHQVPIDDQDKFKLRALDVDGYVLPSDWYMRIAGYAAEALKGHYKIGEEFPEETIRNWKTTHPRLETTSGGVTGSGPSYQQWEAEAAQSNPDEPPPPPYTLEVDENQAHIPTPAPVAPMNTRPTPPVTSLRPEAPLPPRGTRPVSQYNAGNLSQNFAQISIDPRPPPPSLATRPSQSARMAAQADSRPQSYLGSSTTTSPAQSPQWPPADWTQSTPSSHAIDTVPNSEIRSSYSPPPGPPPSRPPHVGSSNSSYYAAPTGPPPPQSGSSPMTMPGPSSYSPAPLSLMPAPGVPMPGGMPQPEFVGGFHPDEDRSGYNPSYYGHSQLPRVPPRPTSAHSPPPSHPQRVSAYPPSSAPPLPSRPSGYGESGGQSQFGLGRGRGGGLVGGMLDRIGNDRRKALEQRVDSVTQAGSKLFGRLGGR
ncbi:unnamed protein product [Peniophora sp. CBMAI 1063]|nr:unnamed protein product [Peniophora sp. CBMAI 1063]